VRAYLIAFGVILVASCIKAQVSPQTLADNAFPPELTTTDDSQPIRYTSVVEDRSRSRIFALYSNGSRAMLQVLSQTGEVQARSNIAGMKGSSGEIELVDLDGDGQPEIVVRLFAGHGLQIPDTWIFRYQPPSLTLISPVQKPGSFEITLLSQIATVDIDGDGKREVIAYPGLKKDTSTGDLVPAGDLIVYSLQNGSLRATATPTIFARHFVRSTKSPEAAGTTFQATAGLANVAIINGGDRPAVTSGHVTLNGQEIVRPSDFKKSTGRFSTSVKLLRENMLAVQLEGTPSSGIWVVINSAQ
jgi:hypothetical protein